MPSIIYSVKTPICYTIQI